jgi:hypothetical protein
MNTALPHEPDFAHPTGVVAHEVGAICPDETALYLRAHRALAIADGAVRWEERGPSPSSRTR